MAEQFRLTVEGWIVLSVGCFPRKPDGSWDTMQITDEQKVKLDALHLRKIDLADRVHVINVGGYVGVSTKNEVTYAWKEGKPITFLEPLDMDQQEHTEVMLAICGEDWQP